MSIYRTRQGDTVDEICWRHYGASSGAVEAVLDANPGLSAKGDVLPIGLEIELPDLEKPGVQAATVKLWD